MRCSGPTRLAIGILVVFLGTVSYFVVWLCPVSGTRAVAIAIRTAQERYPNAGFDPSEADVKWMPHDGTWAVSIYDRGAIRRLYTVTIDRDCSPATWDDWMMD